MTHADRRPFDAHVPIGSIALWQSSSDPAISDDETNEFAIGSRWLNVSSGHEWVCVDPSAGAAVWAKTTGVFEALTIGDLLEIVSGALKGTGLVAFPFDYSGSSATATLYLKTINTEWGVAADRGWIMPAAGSVRMVILQGNVTAYTDGTFNANIRRTNGGGATIIVDEDCSVSATGSVHKAFLFARSAATFSALDMLALRRVNSGTLTTNPLRGLIITEFHS